MNNYKRFSNVDCCYYPCHKLENINCLFCFCPLYHRDCPGNFTYLENGIKDCSSCSWIHGDVYQDVIDLLKN